MKVEKYNFNLDEIKSLYFDQKKGLDEISRLKGCGRKTLRDFLEVNNLLKTREQILKEHNEKVRLAWTDQKKQKMRKRYEETCLEKYGYKNAVQNKEIGQKISQAKKNRSEEEKEEWRKKVRQAWVDKTGEEKQEIKEKVRQAWADKTGEEKLKKVERWKRTIDNKSEEEKREWREKLRNNWTEDKKKEMTDKLKENWKNKTKQEIQEITGRYKETCLKKYGCESPSQKEEIRQKIRQAKNNKTEEEKKKINEKIHKTKIERGLEIDVEKIRELAQRNETPAQIAKELNLHYSSAKKRINQNEIQVKENVATEHWRIVDFIRNELGYNKEIIFNKESKEYILKNKQRLDIYVPNLKIGIEYNGYVFHNSSINLRSPEAKPKESTYHFNKFLQCEKEGIRLISIWDIDWNNSFYNKKIKNILTNIFRPDLLTKIYARKTIIKEIDYTTYVKFLNDYHFKNAKSSKYRFGLYYNNELIEVMGFSEHKRYQYELDRGCINPKYIIVGGSQKLFKYFINKYNPNTILTFSDNDLFTGNTYLRMGFEFVGYTKGSLFWIDIKDKIKLYRNPFKHKEYMKLYREGKLLKCFNSGNKKFIWRQKCETTKC